MIALYTNTMQKNANELQKDLIRHNNILAVFDTTYIHAKDIFKQSLVIE